jgi:CAF1 family ribonuclease
MKVEKSFLPTSSTIASKTRDDGRLDIQNWIEDTSEDKYGFCNISVTSSYYKRILHQSLPSMFPNLMIVSSKKHFIQIMENKESTHDTIKIARKHKFDSRIREAIGLRKVVEMIIQSQCVLVGHNIFQDLVFIWSQFLAKLPDTVESFCHLVSETFPT